MKLISTSFVSTRISNPRRPAKPRSASKTDAEQMDPYLEVIRLGEMRPFANNRFVFPRQIAGFTFTRSEKTRF